MRERPIPFTAPMVRADLGVRKTMTRRAMKPQPEACPPDYPVPGHWWPSREHQTMLHVETEMQQWTGLAGHACPYGQPGDRLWVREAWRVPASLDDLSGKQIADKCLGAGYRKPWCPIQYEADEHRNSEKDWREFGSTPGEAKPGRYRHARFMPRWASRITLEVTGVRIERLHDISYEDALAEGVIDGAAACEAAEPRKLNLAGETSEQIARRLEWPQRYFQHLWESINGAGNWAANPYVWVIEFKRVTP